MLIDDISSFTHPNAACVQGQTISSAPHFFTAAGIINNSSPPTIIGSSSDNNVTVYVKFKDAWRIKVNSLTTARKHVGVALLITPL